MSALSNIKALIVKAEVEEEKFYKKNIKSPGARLRKIFMEIKKEALATTSLFKLR
jgi:hypothetical protein